MSLVRIAVVGFKPAPRSANHFGGEFGDVSVTTLGAGTTELGLEVVLTASIQLEYWPKVTAEGLVVVPGRPREHLERCLEALANTIAASERLRRTITSALPCVGFQAHDDDAREWLSTRLGIHGQSTVVDLPSFWAPIPVNAAELLVDRFDGIALLAEVASQTHALGKFRDLIRLLERAFRLPSSRLSEPLSDFLDPRFGTTREETAEWFAVRDPAMHADMVNHFAMESDARPHLERMLQAATDVVFNKQVWRDPSVARSDRWRLEAWTASREGDGKTVIGTRGTTSATILDPFGVFLCDFKTLSALPSEIWSPPTPVYGSPERSFEVLPADHPDAVVSGRGEMADRA